MASPAGWLARLRIVRLAAPVSRTRVRRRQAGSEAVSNNPRSLRWRGWHGQLARLLAVGPDTRAFRPPWPDRVRLFELDGHQAGPGGSRGAAPRANTALTAPRRDATTRPAGGVPPGGLT